MWRHRDLQLESNSFKGFDEENKEYFFNHNNVAIQTYGKSLIKIKLTGTGKTVSCVPCAQIANTIPTRDANGKFCDYVKLKKITMGGCSIIQEIFFCEV